MSDTPSPKSASTPASSHRATHGPEAAEFFIGGDTKLQKPIGDLVLNTVIAAALVLIATAGMVAFVMQPATGGTIEGSHSVEVEGVLNIDHLPVLHVSRKLDEGEFASAVFLLTGPGKSPFPDSLKSMSGKLVTVRGTIDYRGSIAIMEVTGPESMRVTGEPQPWQELPEPETMAQTGLHGEIISAKCWAGWMKPNTGKVHRACTKRCLEAGLPALISVRDDLGNYSAAIFAPENLDEVKKYYAHNSGRPVYVQGALLKVGDIPVFVPDKDSLRVLYYESLFLFD